MIDRGEKVFSIFYSAPLSDTNEYIQKTQYNKVTINKRIYKKLRRVKMQYGQTEQDQSEY